ncbi:phosphoinositide phosphatase SAC6-like [Olea europaea subsp. europaea]|uniref:Phosphoinositide phosphatase SAC6-like n=1 Tax=Olea europaea subsp. europaea TaxID=158383 RepID=A0A8S0TIM0_OLEEU|nr:phosphoinositide phosphatase SAC6-like [Olea europaea subsp. europaea]
MMEKADPAQKLYNRMRLWEFPDQYVVEPTDGSSGSFLAIFRVDGSMNIIDEIPHCSSLRVPKIRTIFGVVGMLKLLAGSYLLVITERECVGSYLGHPIFKISSMEAFTCDQSLKKNSEEQKKMETEFYRLLNVAERTPSLYFSYDVNITLSVQRVHDLGNESKLLPLWRQADPRFLWNNYMMEALIDNKLDPYLLPVVQGSFQNFQAAVGKDILDVMLIARRCTRRTIIENLCLLYLASPSLFPHDCKEILYQLYKDEKPKLRTSPSAQWASVVFATFSVAESLAIDLGMNWFFWLI